MAVVIQNMTGDEGVCVYEVRINDCVITSFKHNRANGLAACLESAAKAVRKADDNYLVTIYDEFVKGK